MVEERRKSSRRRMLRRGSIVFKSGHAVIDCVLMDMSDEGARLRATTPFSVPQVFELRVERGPRYEAEIAHRTPDGMGVRFKGFGPA